MKDGGRSEWQEKWRNCRLAFYQTHLHLFYFFSFCFGSSKRVRRDLDDLICFLVGYSIILSPTSLTVLPALHPESLHCYLSHDCLHSHFTSSLAFTSSLFHVYIFLWIPTAPSHSSCSQMKTRICLSLDETIEASSFSWSSVLERKNSSSGARCILFTVLVISRGNQQCCRLPDGVRVFESGTDYGNLKKICFKEAES